MKKFFNHLRIYIFRGLWAIIPIFLCVMAINLLYVLIDKKVMALIDKFVNIRQIPGLGLLLVLVCLYLIGMVVSNVIGRRFFSFIENLSRKIPIIKVIYQVGRQVSDSLSDEEGKQAFKKVVLVDCYNNGIWTLAFVAGPIRNEQTGETLLRVFVPTAPNPTSGFVFITKEAQTIDPGWTVEEGVKMVVSGSVISPHEIKKIT